MGEKSHESDRLVLAGEPVPRELAPLDARAGGAIAALLCAYMPLLPDRRAEVHALVRSLPRLDHLGAELTVVYDSASPGGLVLRLLRNRNMNLVAVAQSVFAVTGGRRYWAASTYGRVGGGQKDLTPDLLADLAALLDLTDDHLEALTGIRPGPRPADVVGLVWDLRRLTRGQIERVTKSLV
ncbi:hypothetical protein ACFWN2_05205 [Lentzea sp. NPDC058436]|uniref:hypothetical protein n=1 Tax=Lentzea sp. NPDC058436 TaxID=3346499 RepID=UPI003659091E